MGAIAMRLPTDRITRSNLYFLTGLVVMALVFALSEFAVSVYQHVKYGSFDLRVRGQASLQYTPVREPASARVTPARVARGLTTYRHLRDLAWGNTEPAYSLGGSNGLWFTVTPGRNGDFTLNSAAAGTPYADVGLQIRNQKGEPAHQLVPGEWYQVKQSGRWFTLELSWNP